MSAQTIFVERMLFVLTPLETMTAGVNLSTKEIPLRLAFLNSLLSLISVQRNTVARMLFALSDNASASLGSKETLRI